MHCSQDHLKEECQLVKILCPNDGCSEEITRSQLDDHLQQCQPKRVHHYDQQIELKVI